MSNVSTSEIQSTDVLEKWFKQSESMLVIIDAHRDWSGRCEIILPSFLALCAHHDNCEDRIAFPSMEIPKFAEYFQSKLSPSPVCDTFLPKPNVGNGDDSDDVEQGSGKIGLLVERKDCLPLFLALKCRKLVGVVLGADFPSLAKIIQDNIPHISEEDN